MLFSDQVNSVIKFLEELAVEAESSPNKVGNDLLRLAECMRNNEAVMVDIDIVDCVKRGGQLKKENSA